MPKKVITVVIPAKNEEKTIGKCIESVRLALDGIRDSEIILVDSYSSDNTVEIAKQYPIRILRLKKYWLKTPHAGRYLGTINSNSKYIFFLDADMTVKKDWIKKALHVLDNNENIAGVTGVLYNIFPGNKQDNFKPLDHNIGYCNYLPGAAIFRFEVLKEIKHFNPFFRGYGEREVGYRIAKKGYKQLKLKEVIAYHFKKKKDLKETKEKSSYFIGVGQFLRFHMNMRNLFETLGKYPIIFFSYCIYLFYLIAVTLSLIKKDVFFIVIPILLGLIILLFLIFKQQNLKKTCLTIFHIFSCTINFIRGFLKRKATAEEYPTDVEIIQ
jgi:glycosyltransferase involved in cell wall biosynthesis